MIYEIEVTTSERTQTIEITKQIEKLLKELEVKEGICYIYTPHTTAGIFINENADIDVQEDIKYLLNKIFPWNDKNYRHIEGNTAAHLKSILTNNQQFVFIKNGVLLLGTWQGIFFAEFDGPRRRKIYIKIIKDS